MDPPLRPCQCRAINIKSMLQLAWLHEALELKRACFTFVKRNAASTLTDPAFMLLATEDASLWARRPQAQPAVLRLLRLCAFDIGSASLWW